MQGPLAAAPGAALMDSAALLGVVEDAVAVLHLHLHGLSGDAPVTAGAFLAGQAQKAHHAPLVSLVQGNGGLAVAAGATAGAGKEISHKGNAGQGVHAFTKREAGQKRLAAHPEGRTEAGQTGTGELSQDA